MKSWCMKCGTYDVETIFDSETTMTQEHKRCRQCGNEWVEIDSLWTQWRKRRQGLIT